MTELIREVELLAVRDSSYTMYVFKTLDTNELIMCTRLPSWQSPNVNIGDKGFLQYQIVKSGESYTNPEGKITEYRYSNVYFINFVTKTDVIKNKELIL